MKTEKFVIELPEGGYRVYTEAEYEKAKAEGEKVFETVEEYLDHVYMFETVLADGSRAWVGID